MIGVLYSNKTISDMETMIDVFNLIKNKNESPVGNCNVIDVLYNRFLDYISKVQKLNYLPTKTYPYQDLFRNDCKNRIIRYKPLEKVKKLTIFIKTGSSLLNPNLFTHVVDQFNMEDTGCISILKDKNLAYDVSLSVDNISWYSLFCIEIYPTVNGFDNLEETLNVIHLYFLNFNNWNFEFLINRNKMNFEYKEKEDAIEVVEELSERLQTVPVTNILNFEYLNLVPDQELINEVINNLRDRNQWVVLFADDKFTSTSTDGIFGIEVDSNLV